MKNARGFTLIELIMVIVILGILAAVAIPKFANLQGDAREASIRAATGAIKSAMSIVHARSLIDGTESVAENAIELEGQKVLVTYGYPSVKSISVAAGLDINDYTNVDGVISLNPAIASCNVTYKDATASVPATAILNVSGCN